VQVSKRRDKQMMMMMMMMMMMSQTEESEKNILGLWRKPRKKWRLEL